MRALDGIRRRAEAATAGPWETTQAADEESTTWIEAGSDDILHHDERGDGHMRENFAWMKRADAEFIAHARTDVPRLLGALDAVLALADEWSEEWTAKTPLSSQHAAAIMRRAVNDALDADR